MTAAGEMALAEYAAIKAEQAARIAERNGYVATTALATGPTTAAGSRLPGDAGDAIAGARSRLGAAWRDQDAGSTAAAVRDLAAAAAQHEDAWTPELRDALAALADAGVTGPLEKEAASLAAT